MTVSRNPLVVTRVDELRTELPFAGGWVELWQLEAFCTALREAGAPGILHVTAEETHHGPIPGPVVLRATHTNPRQRVSDGSS